MTARIGVVLVLGACVDISSEHRCAQSSDCEVTPPVGRCELPAGNCSVLDFDHCGGRYRYDDRAGDRAGVCVVTLEGPIEDLPAIQLKTDADRTASSCAPAGALDRFIELESPIAQTVYVLTDPAQTNAAATLVVRDGPCPGTAERSPCANRPCMPTPIGQLLADVPIGRSCLVVEEADPASETGQVRLVLYPAFRTGVHLPSTIPLLAGQASCPMPPSQTDSCASFAGIQAAAYVFAACPGDHDVALTVAPVAPFDPVVTVRPTLPAAPPLPMACENDTLAGGNESFTPPLMVSGPGAFWILVNAVDGTPECGMFSLIDFSITPR